MKGVRPKHPILPMPIVLLPVLNKPGLQANFQVIGPMADSYVKERYD